MITLGPRTCWSWAREARLSDGVERTNSKASQPKIHGRHDRLPIPGEASRECAQLRATDSRELRCQQHILIPLKGYFWRQVTHRSLYEGWRLGQRNDYSRIQRLQQVRLDVDKERKGRLGTRVLVPVHGKLSH